MEREAVFEMDECPEPPGVESTVSQSWCGWKWQVLMYHGELTVSYRLPLTNPRDKVWPWGINMPGLAEDGKGFRCLSYSVHEGVSDTKLQGRHCLSFCNTKVFD